MEPPLKNAGETERRKRFRILFRGKKIPALISKKFR
ncbi:hypothetical protein DESC_290171 [Desulfosarcina cetonica]|nr:hypothetical protein DESC_290171 [Desulfosarcina cetonica]